jgi:hypothetical protein
MAVVRRLEMLVSGRVSHGDSAHAGRGARRAETGGKASSTQALQVGPNFSAFGNAEAAFPLTSDLHSPYVKATPAPETTRRAG